MKIDGKELAAQIFDDLRVRVGELKEKNITPHLAVILVGDNPGSKVYVLQKKLKGEEIQSIVDILPYTSDITSEALLAKIRELNANSTIHAVLVQRPLPAHIDPDVIQQAIIDEKDVDGFKNGSPFHVPVVMAVMQILQEVFNLETQRGVARLGDPRRATATNVRTSDGGEERQDPEREGFLSWLKQKNTVLLGKGSTAGQPILAYFKEIGANCTLIDSRTENPQEILKQADIVISSVGKPNLLTPDLLKKGVILVGVGFTKTEDGKLHGDYEEDQIKDIASFYAPTPGGVGPLNVAMILNNLVTAAENLTKL